MQAFLFNNLPENHFNYFPADLIFKGYVMSDEYLTIESEMPNYSGLSRAALIPKIGMPVVPTIIVIAVTMMLMMFLLPIIGGRAWLILFFAIPILAFIYMTTKNDSKAMNIYMYQALWFLRRRNYFLFGKTNTILAMKYGRQFNDYVQFFEEDQQQQYKYQPKYATKQ